MLPMTVVLLAACAMANGPSIAGTWEGRVNGVKAVTLKLSENDGRIAGQAVFYIIKSQSDGQPVDGTPAAFPISAVQWDGMLLRFSVVNSESEAVKFEMKPSGGDAASLSRLGNDPVTIPLVRRN